MNILNNGRFGMAAALSGTMKSLIAKAVSIISIKPVIIVSEGLYQKIFTRSCQCKTELARFLSILPERNSYYVFHYPMVTVA